MSVSTKKINPILAAYLTSLATNPILTKSTTNGIIAFLSETIAGHLSGSPAAPLSPKQKTGILPVDIVIKNQKAFKLAFYGFFISAPFSHFMLLLLQRAFAGKTSARAKLAMIVTSNVLISPIQQSIYITAMAIINGASTFAEVKAAWSASFMKIMRLTWVISTVSMATAQKFLAPELWVPFFNVIAGVAGTYINVQTKKRIASAKRSADAKAAAEEKK